MQICMCSASFRRNVPTHVIDDSVHLEQNNHHILCCWDSLLKLFFHQSMLYTGPLRMSREILEGENFIYRHSGGDVQ